jgi:transcriptional regulator with XRE-family HTH domain
MSNHPSELDTAIGQRVQALRQARGLSLAALARASGVSKGMLSRVENAQSSATAALLGRVAAGLGLTLSHLLLAPEPAPRRLHRRTEQALWRDPDLGYRRRQVAAADAATGVELVEVELPRRTRVSYPRWQGRPYAQRLWLLEGQLQVDWGDERFELGAGDCVDLVVDRELIFKCGGDVGCRYLLVICADPATSPSPPPAAPPATAPAPPVARAAPRRAATRPPVRR